MDILGGILHGYQPIDTVCDGIISQDDRCTKLSKQLTVVPEFRKIRLGRIDGDLLHGDGEHNPLPLRGQIPVQDIRWDQESLSPLDLYCHLFIDTFFQSTGKDILKFVFRVQMQRTFPHRLR